MNGLRQHWEDRYQSAALPWDSKITPPEVVAFWQSELSRSLPKASRALDIGSGTGTNVAYLSALGHLATGVELSQTAINIAAARHQSLPPRQRQRISMVQGSAASIPFNQPNFHYILDIGCLHGLLAVDRPSYAAGVVDNLHPGGFYHLYGFDKSSDDGATDKLATDKLTTVKLATVKSTTVKSTKEPELTAQERLSMDRGLGPTEVIDLLGPQMVPVHIEQANPNPTPCRWYLFRKA